MFRTIISLAAALFASSASAQMMAPCVPLLALEKMLLEQYDESPVLAGIVRGGALAMKLLVSRKTWTIIHIQPLGDCAWIVSAGSDLMTTGDVPPAGEGM